MSFMVVHFLWWLGWTGCLPYLHCALLPASAHREQPCLDPESAGTRLGAASGTQDPAESSTSPLAPVGL